MISSTRGKQVLLITGTVLLTAALYFAPQNETESQRVGTVQNEFSFDRYLQEAKNSLQASNLQQINQIEERLKSESENLALFDTLALLWSNHQQMPIAAYYCEKKAEKSVTEENWLNAAYRYFDSFRSAPDSVLRSAWVAKTIECYKKVLSINKDNLNAQTDLGLCYAEGTAEPMKGIMLLREVVQKDSMHENAQYNLGILSVRSGQYDKAIDRFEKVLVINPARNDIYFMIGRTYMMEGNKEKAREYFERFKSTTTDVAMVNETNNLLKQLNNN